ncbi:glycosyltransferase family 4 protein [Jonesiaceae bacterium BS-20]|uniref:D-inositol 3-phosphate glycosyltransferase n=1 Tax=Jonesiaceae bacterium BS-20 TaxID=3120821 RepID=A0AAU7E014_9MICO
MSKTLVITNDFPPQEGGIETFVIEVLKCFPSQDVVVYTSAAEGAPEYDAALPFPVIRDQTKVLLPTKRVTERAIAVAKEYGCDRVWFGAAAPLAFMAKHLRAAGIKRIVATSHGHEIWWARIPGARAALRRIGRDTDVVTFLGEYTRSKIAPGLGKQAFLARLVPGAHANDFGKDIDPQVITDLKNQYGLAGKKVIVCVSRLVKRKGQDVLIKAMPQILEQIPDAILVIVGRGPYEQELRKLAAKTSDSVVITGGVPYDQLINFYAAADIFAMPTRNRLMGLEAEGLGIVFLEASASRLPVIAGDSGGAPDAVLEGVTGYVVDGTNIDEVATKIIDTLQDPNAKQMGLAGRQWVKEQWSWEGSAQRLQRMLDPGVPLSKIDG